MRTAALPLILVACVAATPLAGQDAPDTVPSTSDGTRVSFGIGLGVGSLDFGGTLGLSVDARAHSFMLRSATSTEFTIFSPPASVVDVGVLYGRRWTGQRGFTRLAGGPSVVMSERPGEPTDCAFFFCDYSMQRATTLGLAVQADAVWSLARSFGLGAQVFANLNGKLSFAGLSVGVHFGELR